MKRNLKHYRQIASTVLITTLLMAPSLSPLTSLADNPDDGVMYEDIIEDADEGYYDEEDTVVYSRAARVASGSNLNVTALDLTEPEKAVDAGTKNHTIDGSVTIASGSNWTDGLASSSNATSAEVVSDNIKLSIPQGLYATAPTKVSSVTINGTTATFKISGDIADDAKGDYTVTAAWGEKTGTATVTVTPKTTEKKEVTLEFPDTSLEVQEGKSKNVTMKFNPDGIWEKVNIDSDNPEAVKVTKGKSGIVILEGLKVTEEPVTVTAAFEENEEYQGAEATLSVTVTAASLEEEGTVTLLMEGGDLIIEPEEEGTATIVAKVDGGFPTAEDVMAGVKDVVNDPDGVIEYSFDQNTGKIKVKGLKPGNASITYSYANSKGESEVTLQVRVVKAAETVEPAGVNTEGAEVDVAGADFKGGNKPEGVTEQEHQKNVEDIKNAVEKSLTSNKNLKGDSKLIINNGQNLAEFGVKEPEGVIYPLQKLESMTMGYENGTPVLKSMKFDISLYWRPKDFDSNARGAKLKSGLKGSFKFRIPVPEIVGNKKYANVKHNGTLLPQYTIQKDGNGWYITVKVNSFSPFEVEFTDTRRSSGSSSGGSGGSGSSGHSTTTANTQPDTMFGNWQQDEQGWRFMQNNGTYAANAWGRINGFWYYFGENTYMQTGWIFVGEQWYYLSQAPESIGKMQTGPVHDVATDRWFYADDSGAIQTGWQYIEESWRYLDPASEGVRGAMVTNQWVDGRYLDAQGKWNE